MFQLFINYSEKLRGVIIVGPTGGATSLSGKGWQRRLSEPALPL